MLFDIADCRPMEVNDIPGPGLLLAEQADRETILSLVTPTGLVGVMLDGEWAFHACPIPELKARRGLFVPDVRVRVDLASMGPDENSPIGAVLRGPNAYGVKARYEVGGGGQRSVPVPLSGEAAEYAMGDVRLAFRRWEIGRMVDDAWACLRAIEV